MPQVTLANCKVCGAVIVPYGTYTRKRLGNLCITHYLDYQRKLSKAYRDKVRAGMPLRKMAYTGTGLPDLPEGPTVKFCACCWAPVAAGRFCDDVCERNYAVAVGKKALSMALSK